MNKTNCPDNMGEEHNEYEAKSDAMYEKMMVSTPKLLSERIKRYSREAMKLRKTNKQTTTLAAFYEDEFILMAAAESSDNKVRELKSQSGEWSLRIYEDLDNRDQGYIILEVSPNHASEFNGKSATLDIGNQHILLGQIENGEAEAPISLTDLVLDEPISLKIE